MAYYQPSKKVHLWDLQVSLLGRNQVGLIGTLPLEEEMVRRGFKGGRVGWRREMCCNAIVYTCIERMVFLDIFKVSTLIRK